MDAGEAPVGIDGGTAITTANERPAGTVSLLLADVEDSVALWEQEPEAMRAATDRLRATVSTFAERYRGYLPVEQGEGDSFVLAFAAATDAVACGLAIQRALIGDEWPVAMKVRMGIHSGAVQVRGDGTYEGTTINRCARVRNLGHGGQVLLSRTAAELVADRLPADASLRSLGAYALRGLTRPEEVVQLCHPDLQTDFPPLRASSPPSGAPVQLAPTIGREGEIDDVVAAWSANRVVTLTGAGGCGKTRLAAEVAGRAAATRPDGVYWVDLGLVVEPAAVVQTVQAATVVQEVSGADQLEVLAAALAGRDLSIVLDNCEHLIEAAAALVESLVARCPNLTVLATSREPLGIAGEVTYRVPSLAVPSSGATNEEIREAPAVRLFAERARRSHRDFTLRGSEAAVAEICRRVDGIPLAIELAAARIRMLSPQEIAEGLSDRFTLLTGGARGTLPRQRTLEASVDWSYSLLTTDERALLQRISVFAGTFDVAGAKAVAADGHTGSVLELLAKLIDRSLLQVETTAVGTRYRMLETIRIYARQRLLDAGGLPDARSRHLEYYAAVAAAAGGGEASGTAGWFQFLDVDLDNLRAAIDWALASGSLRQAQLVLNSVARYYIARGLFAEAVNRSRAVLDVAEDDSVRIRGLYLASVATLMSGDMGTGRALAEEGVELAREHGDVGTLAVLLPWLAWAETWTGATTDQQLAHAAEGYELARRHGNADAQARAAYYRAQVEGNCFGPATAVGHMEQAVQLAERAGLVDTAVYAEMLLGALHLYAGKFDKATETAQHALQQAQAFDIRPFRVMAQRTLADVALYTGDYAAGRRLATEGAAFARRHGMVLFETHAWLTLASQLYAVGDLAAARRALEEGRRVLASGRNIPFLVMVDAQLALVALQEGDVVAAQRHLAAVEDVRASAHLLPVAAAPADVASARVHRAVDRPEAAETAAHCALGTATRAGLGIARCDALELLAGIAVDAGRAEEAARLFGAAHRLRAELGYARFPIDTAEHEETINAARAMLGASFDKAWAEGLSMTAEEAVAYARRGRGQRNRPPAGWDSLTPTELEVTRHVADGLANPEIAARMFVSRNTVKTHLSHIFAKLAISSRAQLAGLAAQRGLTGGETSNHPAG